MVCRNSRPAHGSVTLQSLDESHELVSWRPAAADLVGALPEDPHLDMRSTLISNRLRFVRRNPTMGMPLFRATASMLGLSLRARNEDWDRERWLRSLVAGHALDFATRSKRLLKTRFSCWQSFKLLPQLQLSSGLSDRLPLDFGMGPDGTDRLTPSALAQLGKRTAIKRGIAKPKPIQIVAYGLAAAAERRPISLSENEVAELVRSILFDGSCIATESCAAKTAVVEEHLTELLFRHLDEDRARFTKWFAGGSSNLVKALMTRCRAHGTALSRDEVIRGLLDLAWRGCLEMGANIEAFAQDFAAAMNAAHIPFEADDFAAIHHCRSCFGGLPLIMLIDERGFLKPAVDNVLARPNYPEAVGVLHGVMKTYAEAARISRSIERLKKRSCSPGTSKGSEAEQRRTDELQARNAAPLEFTAIIDDILEYQKIACPRCGEQPEGVLVASRTGEHIRIQLNCRTHRKIRTLEITEQEIRSARRRIFG